MSEKEQKSGRGGARPGAGKKPKPEGAKRQRRLIFASDQEWAELAPVIKSMLDDLRSQEQPE